MVVVMSFRSFVLPDACCRNASRAQSASMVRGCVSDVAAEHDRLQVVHDRDRQRHELRGALVELAASKYFFSRRCADPSPAGHPSSAGSRAATALYSSMTSGWKRYSRNSRAASLCLDASGIHAARSMLTRTLRSFGIVGHRQREGAELEVGAGLRDLAEGPRTLQVHRGLALGEREVAVAVARGSRHPC